VLLGMGAGCGATEEQIKKADGYYREGFASLEADRQQAYVSFQKAVQENPNHRDAHYYIGHILANQRKYGPAEREFREVIRIDPDYSEAHTYLGVVLASQDRWQEAIKEYRRALDNPLYPTPDVALYNLGQALAREGDMQGAAQAFEDALQVRPPNVQPAQLHLQLGIAYYRLGSNEKAREALRQVTALDKGGQFAADAEKWLQRLKP
jgi:Tfp pilus assembly protein PilF